MKRELKRSSEKPFEGTNIYYSGSMAGVAEFDPDFPSDLIEYMIQNGGNVLDPHVAIPHKGDEFITAMAAVQGFTFEEWLGLEQHEKDTRIYQHDISLVDKASHVVTLLNGASHGVGMEIQEAIRKPDLGMNPTPILGLIHESLYMKLSPMMRGASHTIPLFSLRTYTNLATAQQEIHQFLTVSK